MGHYTAFHEKMSKRAGHTVNPQADIKPDPAVKYGHFRRPLELEHNANPTRKASTGGEVIKG